VATTSFNKLQASKVALEDEILDGFEGRKKEGRKGGKPASQIDE
jgi:hypothetical protein